MVVGYTLRAALNRPDISKYLTAKARTQIIFDLCKAVHYLHSQRPKIVHKDLKSENVLLDLNCNVKLCDFADAEEIDTHTKCYTATTWLWGPPELVLNFVTGTKIKMNEKVDIWAIGCIILEILGHKTPFYEIIERNNKDGGSDTQKKKSQPQLIYSALKDMKVIPLPLNLPKKFRKL